MKILVTGSAGFIAFHLSKRLASEGNEVVSLDNINDYYGTTIKYDRLQQLGFRKEQIEYNKLVTSETFPNHRFIKLDLTDREKLHTLFEQEKFEFVVNLAAQAGVRYSIENPYTYLESNIEGFLNIIEGCRNNPVKHLVFASSSSVYGMNTGYPFSVDVNVDHPLSLYAASKKSNELMAHSYSYLYQLPVTGLRFFTAYGPWGRPDMALFIFTKAILEEKPIDIYNHGNMMRDFTFIEDLIEGIVRIIQHVAEPDETWDSDSPTPSTSSVPYQLYNIGNNSPVKLLDFIDAIEEALGKKAIRNYMPLQIGDISKTYADVDKLVNDVGYKPGTPIKKGVEAFVSWYRDYFKV